MASITDTGFCQVILQYGDGYGNLGAPQSWGSAGQCAWCDATTNIVYVNPSESLGPAYACGPNGGRNSEICISVGSCDQDGPGFYTSLVSSIQTVTYVDVTCSNDDTCTDAEYVTATALYQSGAESLDAASNTTPFTTAPYDPNTSSTSVARVTVIGGACDVMPPTVKPTTCLGYRTSPSSLPVSTIAATTPAPSSTVESSESASATVPASTGLSATQISKADAGPRFSRRIVFTACCAIFLSAWR